MHSINMEAHVMGCNILTGSKIVCICKTFSLGDEGGCVARTSQCKIVLLGLET